MMIITRLHIRKNENITQSVIPTAVMQLRRRMRNRWLNHAVCAVMIVFAAFMVAGRLVSGVHWVTDIVGGMLLSAGLVTVYAALCGKRE